MKYREILTCLRLSFYFTFLFSLITPAMAAPGDLDLSFGNKGKTIVSFTQNQDSIQDLAIQSDGKIVAVGSIGFQPGIARAFGVARFNSNGSLDTSFGNGGSVTTSFDTPFAGAEGLVIQPDGKIVVCGRASYSDGRSFIAVARYLTNGTLDSSFSLDGKVETGMGLYSSGDGIALQPDGKIVVVGSTNGNLAVVRYTSEGFHDRTFGHRGKVITSGGGRNGLDAKSVRVQPDGKIIAAGEIRVYAPPNFNEFFAVVRYNQNGKIDTSFDNDGIQITDFGIVLSNWASDLELQTDGKILVAGVTAQGNPPRNLIAIARYNLNGSLDTSFNQDGKVVTESGGSQGYANALSVQTNGKIIVGGSVRDTSPSGYSDFLMFRYNSDGFLDNNFGIGGRVQTSMSPEYDEIQAVALQSDGKIVVGGSTPNNAGTAAFALARYFGD